MDSKLEIRTHIVTVCDLVITANEGAKHCKHAKLFLYGEAGNDEQSGISKAMGLIKGLSRLMLDAKY